MDITATLIYPVGINQHGRTSLGGIVFDTLNEARTFQRNAQFKRASLIYGGTLYEATAAGFSQAEADNEEN